jgi:primase-polymerase (primpol)-like protein
MIDKAKIPQELAVLPNWVCYRIEPDKRTGKAAKVPYNPKTGYKASSNNPQTWATLDEALFSQDRFLFAGVGFVFTEECGIVGIDLDHCLDTQGKPNEIASDILSKLPPTYVEISPSGTGLHIFLFGKLPYGGNKNSKLGVEMYCKSRYFTVTGNAYHGSVPQIGLDNGVIDFVYSQYIVVGKTKKHKVSSHPGRPLSDDELLDLAQNSRDGAAFKALWEGAFEGEQIKLL